jgi:hypothetical protein
MKHVLIVDPDIDFRGDLTIELKKLGDYKVSAVPTLNEACLALIQETQDVAFIPMTDDDRPVRSLLVLQSDIRVIMTTNSVSGLPDKFANKVHGILPKNRLDTALSGILAIVFDKTNRGTDTLESTTARAAIHTGILGPRVQSALLLNGAQLVTNWGDLSKAEASLIAETVSEGWTEAVKTTQVQFLRLPERGAVFLLYTRTIASQSEKPGKRYVLTLVSAPEVSLSWLRARADALVGSLSQALVKRPSATADPQPEPEITPNGPTYAIAWRPITAVPETRIIPLRRALERIAIANACALTYIDVKPQLIHLVVTCPPSRSSSWAAHILKSGADEALRQAYGSTKPLWDLGYYARESADPLTPAELNIFLQRQ